MSSPQEKKRKTNESSGGSQRKRGADRDLSSLTLGQVAAEARFVPLQVLLEPVKDTPVNELGEDLRAALKKRGGDELELLLASFFGACGARVEEEARKRAHVASEEHSPGKQWRKCSFSLCFLFLLFCAPSSGLLVTVGVRKAPHVGPFWMHRGGEAR